MKNPRNRSGRAQVPDPDEHGDATVPVMVPRLDRDLAPVPPGRLRQLRLHLARSLRAMRMAPVSARPSASPPGLPPPPAMTDFTARVAREACALCQGWCCRNGGEHAYLDERTLARLHRARPDIGAWDTIRLYLRLVPAQAYAGSCIFHGPRGCTLSPDLRSDVCNAYFCGGLGAFVARDDTGEAVTVMAGEGAAMRRTRPIRP